MVSGHNILYIAGLSIGLAASGQAHGGTATNCLTCDLAPAEASALPSIGFGAPAAGQENVRTLGYGERDPFADAGFGGLRGEGRLRERILAGVGDDGLSIYAIRRTANRRDRHDIQAPLRDRRAGVGLAAEYRMGLGSSDVLTLSAEAARESRRAAFDRSGRPWTQSRGYGLGASWVHDANWQLAAGYLHSDGQKRRTKVQRSVDLAEGAAPSADGYRLEVAFSPEGFGRESPWSVGIAARSLNLSRADSRALGRSDNRETRLAATLRSRF